MSLFTRGYKECKERVEKNSRYIRSCFNCEHYYQGYGDREEMCQNSDVLEYDMVIEGNNISCLQWKPCTKKEDSMFRKNVRGRAKLE